jgi:hypothetical protein
MSAVAPVGGKACGPDRKSFGFYLLYRARMESGRNGSQLRDFGDFPTRRSSCQWKVSHTEMSYLGTSIARVRPFLSTILPRSPSRDSWPRAWEDEAKASWAYLAKISAARIPSSASAEPRRNFNILIRCPYDRERPRIRVWERPCPVYCSSAPGQSPLSLWIRIYCLPGDNTPFPFQGELPDCP